MFGRVDGPERVRLRVGVVLDALETQAWVGELVARLADDDAVAALVLVTGSRPPDAGRAVAAYERVDRRLFGAVGDATQTVPLPGTVPVVSVTAETAAGVAAGERVDVLLWLAQHPPAAAGAVPVWWLDVEGVPPFLAAVGRGDATVLTRILTHGDAPGTVREVGRIVTGADPVSLRRVRGNARRQAVEVLLACLTRARDGVSHAAEHDDVPPPPARPVRGLAAGVVTARVVGRIARRRARSLASEEQWVVCHRRRPARDVTAGNMTGFATLQPARGRSFADPFLATHEGRRYLFFEDQVHDAPAAISRVELFPDGTASEPVEVLRRAYHLSYPQVLHRDGAWLMLPETAANGTVELYRAVDFPDRWELDRVLVEGVRAYDTTVFEHDGRTWLFATVGVHGGVIAETLSLFWAESLTGVWEAHPGNPVVADVRSSRPAGRIIRRDGRIVRPSQDGSGRYGRALVFNEIEELSPETYRERELLRIEPGWARGGVAVHHYDSDDEVEVVDSRRRRLRSPVRRMRPA
jgi:hypothetical protein